MNPIATHTTDDLGVAWKDDAAWQERLDSDRRRAQAVQTTAQRAFTETVVERALAVGAEAVALTGSTVRMRRTAISDLDYHVVGPRPQVSDLPGDVDIYASDRDAFWKKLRGGDDFVQWTLREGCILVDSDIFRDGLRAIAVEGLWPNPGPKLERLPAHMKIVGRLLAMGDRDAAQAELRAALTSAARAVLLGAEVFPLARAELPEQLRMVGAERLGEALRVTIDTEPSLEDLQRFLDVLAQVAHVDVRT